MNEPILSVRFFRTEAGKEPVRDFLYELPKMDRKIIGTDIKEVQFGWPLGMPLVRKLEKDVCEIRCRLYGRIARVLFTVIDRHMVLLHAFIKKTQKTPKSELDTARVRKDKALGGVYGKSIYRE